MAESLDLKNIVKNLANACLGCNLCLVCLSPLQENGFVNIFSKEEEFSVAKALEDLCHFKFDPTDNYNTCTQCFRSASIAYKFYYQSKQSYEILSFYSQELLNVLQNVEISDSNTENLLWIPLPIFDSECGLKHVDKSKSIAQVIPKKNLETESKEDNIVVVVQDGIASYYKVLSDGTFKQVEKKDEEFLSSIKEKKSRKKRDRMVYMPCSKCPIKYRFVAKLKEHMKTTHNIELYYCKICKLTTEDKDMYEEHLKKHWGEYQCTVCNMVYKKCETLEAHMKTHDKINIQKSDGMEICEVCGALLKGDVSLEEHMNNKHAKKFTCYYCGRMYKVEASFNVHIKKHEAHFKKKSRESNVKSLLRVTQSEKEENKVIETRGVNGAVSEGEENERGEEKKKEKGNKQNRAVCTTCGKDFVDERALLWHQRLHNNDRPFICDVCGRAFVCRTRRNQHALCAHTRPSLRCPLCPALFHLRSIVNTHVKKVHLKSHKRRNRTSQPQNVFWRTETVPIQDLSVSIQNEVLEMQTNHDDARISNGLENAHVL